VRVAAGWRTSATRAAPARLATALFAALALVAFAANSVLCRLALGSHAVDAASFALLRLGSGAGLLLGLRAVARDAPRAASDWAQPLALFVYAAAFAYAYLSLQAGAGALILFGCVQATMIVGALRSGERFSPLELVGLLMALGGLAYLVAPGLAAPPPVGAALMAAAGIAWGVYTLRGRGTRDALGATARNFSRAVLPALLVGLIALRHAHVTPRGALLAVVSGAITSALGYVLWFAALRGMSAIQAAIVQLAVPAIAAAGGVLLLAERITLRLVIAAILILGGVAVAVVLRRAGARATP
jgi:drug/metabolite transporter (DMT)-like permease